MRVKVYVNHIFPAYILISEQNGKILSDPELIASSWINKLFDWWLFYVIMFLTAIVFEFHNQEPQFVCRLAKSEVGKLKRLGLLNKTVWGNL